MKWKIDPHHSNTRIVGICESVDGLDLVIVWRRLILAITSTGQGYTDLTAMAMREATVDLEIFLILLHTY